MIISLILQFIQNLNLPLRIALIFLIIFYFFITNKNDFIAYGFGDKPFELWFLGATYICYYFTEHLLVDNNNLDMVLLIYKVMLFMDIIAIIVVLIINIGENGIYAIPIVILKILIMIIPGIIFAVITFYYIIISILIFILCMAVISML